MSNIKIVNDAYGRPHPVKEEQLFEYGIKPDGSTLGTVAGVGSQILQVISGSISSAEIMTAYDSPVVLIPAPGANKVNLVVSYLARFNYETEAYDAATYLRYSSDLSKMIGQDFANIQYAGTNFRPSYYYYMYDSSVFPSTIANDDIVMHLSMTPTQGDGTVDYIIHYITCDFSEF